MDEVIKMRFVVVLLLSLFYFAHAKASSLYMPCVYVCIAFKIYGFWLLRRKRYRGDREEI